MSAARGVAETADAIAAILAGHRYRFSDEAALRDSLSAVLDQAGIVHVRELQLSPHDRIDFYLPDEVIDGHPNALGAGLGIEVKVGGSLTDLTRQIHRYLQHASVSGLIVVTSRLRHDHLPDTFNGKPVRVVALLQGLC